MKTFRAMLLVLVLIVPFFMSGAQDDMSSLSVGMDAPVQLDPHIGSNDPETLFNRQIYDYLVDVDANGSLVPQLATDWTISDDGLTYTFNLLEGVTFHDGSAFTSADVVFSFNRLKELESPAMALLGDFEIAADGDSAVVFTLGSANADFLYGVSSRFAFILKDGATDINVLTDDYGNFNGTGPFVLTSYSEGESAEFVANENYWIEGEPMVDSLTFLFIEEQEAQINAVRTGDVDFIFKINEDRIAELSEVDGLEVLVKATNRHPVVRIRSDAGALGEDVRVRQAFKLATDRELLALDLFGEGVATVGNNDPIGPKYGDFYVPIPDEYDPAAACDLLAEAGYPDGLGADEPIEFYVVNAFNYSDMAEFLQDQWSEGCINVEILVREPGVYYADTEWLEVDLGVTGWGDRPIAQPYFLEAYVDGGVYNESHWSDPEVEELVAQAGVTADIAARAELYQQISAIFAERGPIIVPFFGPIVGVVSSDVSGIDLHPFAGRTDLRKAVVGGM